MTEAVAPVLPGISLRDYFAGCALAALLPQAVATQQNPIVTRQGEAGATIDIAPPGVRWASVRAYQVADAMVRLAAQVREQELAAAAAAAAGAVLPGPGSNGHVDPGNDHVAPAAN